MHFKTFKHTQQRFICCDLGNLSIQWFYQAGCTYSRCNLALFNGQASLLEGGTSAEVCSELVNIPLLQRKITHPAWVHAAAKRQNFGETGLPKILGSRWKFCLIFGASLLCEKFWDSNSSFTYELGGNNIDFLYSFPVDINVFNKRLELSLRTFIWAGRRQEVLRKTVGGKIFWCNQGFVYLWNV